MVTPAAIFLETLVKHACIRERRSGNEFRDSMLLGFPCFNGGINNRNIAATPVWARGQTSVYCQEPHYSIDRI